MTAQDEPQHDDVDEPDPATIEPPETVRTGISRVDAVLESLEVLEEQPVADHVAVFERAHEELRRALDADPDA